MADQPIPHALANGGGLIQDTFDERDHYYTPQADTQPLPRVNLRQGDHARLTSEIYDQKTTGSCTAHAAAAAFWYEEKGGPDKEVWQLDGPSRLFIYWLARGGYKTADHSISPPPQDKGSMMREAMKGLGKLGACHEAMWPFIVENVNKQPSPDAFRDASSHNITAYYRLDPLRPDKDDPGLTPQIKDFIGTKLLKDLKCCLTEGFPVAFAFWFYLPGAKMFDISGKNYVLKDVWAPSGGSFPRNTALRNLPKELQPRDADGNIIFSGHAVLAIGYDDDRQQVLVQNSWGSTWGGDGTFWVPYDWIIDCSATIDFWTIRTSQHAPQMAFKSFEDVNQEIMAAV
ncbi:hypothetical protein E8E14_007785 [Neopestalotiopsis sp. 37M]|nr:hypothetical protein E8E14_007785 [Neopestalotiopsis sp. 37M]